MNKEQLKDLKQALMDNLEINIETETYEEYEYDNKCVVTRTTVSVTFDGEEIMRCEG